MGNDAICAACDIRNCRAWIGIKRGDFSVRKDAGINLDIIQFAFVAGIVGGRAVAIQEVSPAAEGQVVIVSVERIGGANFGGFKVAVHVNFLFASGLVPGDRDQVVITVIDAGDRVQRVEIAEVVPGGEGDFVAGDRQRNRVVGIAMVVVGPEYNRAKKSVVIVNTVCHGGFHPG